MAEKEQLSEALERLERDIDKEVTKLKHYMEPADELIENNDYLEMKIAVKQATQIISKITDLNFTTGNLEAGLWELRRETFNSGRRTRRTSFLPVYRKGTKFPNYCRLNKDKGTKKSGSRIGRPNGSVRSASPKNESTGKGILGGKVQSRVARGRAKVGDGNCRKGYSCKAS